MESTREETERSSDSENDSSFSSIDFNSMLYLQKESSNNRTDYYVSSPTMLRYEKSKELLNCEDIFYKTRNKMISKDSTEFLYTLVSSVKHRNNIPNGIFIKLGNILKFGQVYLKFLGFQEIVDVKDSVKGEKKVRTVIVKEDENLLSGLFRTGDKEWGMKDETNKSVCEFCMKWEGEKIKMCSECGKDSKYVDEECVYERCFIKDENLKKNSMTSGIEIRISDDLICSEDDHYSVIPLDLIKRLKKTSKTVKFKEEEFLIFHSITQNEIGSTFGKLILIPFKNGHHPLRIGRDGDNDVSLKNNTISRFHALITFEKSMKQDNLTRFGNLFLRDLNSKYGTYLLMKEERVRVRSRAVTYMCKNVLYRIEQQTLRE